MVHRRLARPALLLGLAILGCAVPGDGAQSTTLDPFAMKVGDCFDDTGLGSGDVLEIPRVACSAPHDNEVYALFDLPGDAWVSDDDAARLADAGCLELFEAAIGAPFDTSIIAYTTLYPSEDSWETLADREVVCIAYHMDTEKLRGSVLGWGR